jgi:signal peptidase II
LSPSRSDREPRSSSRATAVALAVAGAILVADQALKALVRGYADGLPYDLGFGVRLRLVENPGVSFSRLTDAPGLVLAAVAALAVALTVAVFVAAPRYRLALGVLLGGALGNVVDRVRYGAVVDFVDAGWWPTFNLADVAIVTGVALVLIQVLRGRDA